MKIYSVSSPTDKQITTSLTSLCKQWRENRGDHLPGICQHLMTNEDDHLPITIIPGKSYFSPIQHQSDSLATERNLSIAGVLAGLLFILLIIAAVLRIRARNNKKVLRRDTDSVEYEMCHLNTSQLSTIVDVPPDYQTVEEEDTELPSYDEALLEQLESGVHSSL
eukprot:TRINITY_DN792_c0_g1_i1.p1 TRINITY_DN792_c0_g1~~TRINITY_DN792_c0_g1_i1.p1  ORF type:complete len:165 (+),score=48.60 TRINITY_DN792_c0_g1_i1:118-612(+)